MSGTRFESWLERRISRSCYWYTSVSWDSTPIRLWLSPSRSFQIHHTSSYHSALYNLATDSVVKHSTKLHWRCLECSRMSSDSYHFYLLTSTVRADLSIILVRQLIHLHYGSEHDAIWCCYLREHFSAKADTAMLTMTSIPLLSSSAPVHRCLPVYTETEEQTLANYICPYCPFINDAVCSSGYAVSDTKICEWWTENDLVRGGGSLNSGATLTVAWKPHVLTLYSSFMDRDLIPRPATYKRWQHCHEERAAAVWKEKVVAYFNTAPWDGEAEYSRKSGLHSECLERHR
jgi:hypothetical protein